MRVLAKCRGSCSDEPCQRAVHFVYVQQGYVVSRPSQSRGVIGRK
jgi:hypothetical protein